MFSECFELFASGRQLFGESIERTAEVSSEAACQRECLNGKDMNNKKCSYYSFG